MNNGIEFSKNLGIKHNVTFNIFDERTRELVHSHQGHNCATNSMLTGIAHYLAGDGIFNQGYEMLRYWVPQYMSVGTMGLPGQAEDSQGLPIFTAQQCIDYMDYCPGYTADGYDDGRYNSTTPKKSRPYLGLGPKFANRSNKNDVVDCELVSDTHRRVRISAREVVPEAYSELPYTVDVTLTGMISTGALSEFRLNDNKYIFITEAGLWSVQNYVTGGDNGLLAGYRIVPPNDEDQDMTKAENREKLRHEILRVGFNQVVQIIWKIQIGDIDNLNRIYAEI